MAKVKPAPQRNLGNELSNINSQAASTLAARNPKLLEALLSNLSSTSSGMTTAREGEMNSLAAWLGKDKSLKAANQTVQQATRTATAPTPLAGQLDSTASTALSDPTAGNRVLQNLAATSGPSQLLQTMTSQAQSGLADNGQLTPEEERLAVQGGRASMAARGLNGGSGAVLEDVLNRQQYVQDRQDRERQYAATAEGLGQSSRQNDLGVANTLQGAIDAGRTMALNVNAQDMTRTQQNLAATTAGANYRLQTDPRQIAYGTPSMVPGATATSAGIVNEADVYPQILSYGSDLNNTNTNMLESRYLNAQNAQYANQAGQQQLAASKQAAGASTTSAAIAGGVVVAAAAAV